MTKRGQAVPKTNRFLSLPLLTYHRLQWLWRSKGTKLSHAAVEALTRWAQDVEREAWASGELFKEAEQPFPPRPPGATNRRGGARTPSSTPVVQTSVALPTALEERLLRACWHLGLQYNAEAVRYLDAYLDEQGAPATPEVDPLTAEPQ